MEIQNWGADVLISLIASQEFVQLGVPEFPEVANRQKFDWYHLPIQDFYAPGDKFQEAWSNDREAILKYGEYIMMPAHERTKIDVPTQRRSYTHSPSPSTDRLMLGKNVRFRSHFNVREVV